MELSEKLKLKLKSIPPAPGIYKMLDENGDIIYIGKSISLKQRARSYFRDNHKIKKIEKMVKLIDDIEIEVSDTHLEARLKECAMIKEIKPLFNTQFKNHLKYVYLDILDYNQFKAIDISYEASENSYGPFRSFSLLMEIKEALENLYPIIKNNDIYDFEYSLFPRRMDKKQFILNQISLNDIFSDLDNFQLFLDLLESKMKDASQNLKFELALYYKTLIKHLGSLQYMLYKYKELIEKDIVLKIPVGKSTKLLYIKYAKVINSKLYKKLSSNSIEVFIRDSKKYFPIETVHINKKNMDFIGILYSEISSYTEDMIIYLN